MDFDLVQLIDDDDDELLEVPAASETVASSAQLPGSSSQSPPTPAAPASSSLPSLPPPVAASARSTSVHAVDSHPPSYHESSGSPPLGAGCPRTSLISITVLLVFISVVSVSFNAVAIAFCSQFSAVGHGIWTAVVCLHLGASNIYLIRRNKLRVATLTLVLASLAFVCAFIQGGISLMSTVLDSIPPSHSQHCPKHDFNVAFLSSLILTLCGLGNTALSIVNIILAARILINIRRSASEVYCISNSYTYFYSASDQQITATAAPPPYSLPEYSPRQQPPPYKSQTSYTQN